MFACHHTAINASSERPLVRKRQEERAYLASLSGSSSVSPRPRTELSLRLVAIHLVQVDSIDPTVLLTLKSRKDTISGSVDIRREAIISTTTVFEGRAQFQG